jgi:hypothetical protein
VAARLPEVFVVLACLWIWHLLCPFHKVPTRSTTSCISPTGTRIGATATKEAGSETTTSATVGIGATYSK